ncbi:MAG: YggT family protein [Pedosphaera sp.]|nr:YggT family protein [Pedosphaera sp.]
MTQIARVFDLLIKLFTFGLFVRMFLSWITPAGSALKPAMLYLDKVYEPILRPIRRIVKPIKLNLNPPSSLDLSPLLLLVGLWWFIHPFAMWLTAQPG